MRLPVGERCSTWGARRAELRLAVPRKTPLVLPAPQEAAASADADRVEPRLITSPEHCDQSVICRSSLGQIGNELSTAAIADGLDSTSSSMNNRAVGWVQCQVTLARPVVVHECYCCAWGPRRRELGFDPPSGRVLTTA